MSWKGDTYDEIVSNFKWDIPEYFKPASVITVQSLHRPEPNESFLILADTLAEKI